MKKLVPFLYLLVFSAMLTLLLVSCSGNSLTYPQNGSEFVIKFGGEKGFAVVDIRSSETKYVPAVKELAGRLYLPIMSSMPSFNKKVVQGSFVPDTNYYLGLKDTIFRVTKHLRDTTSATVGQ